VSRRGSPAVLGDRTFRVLVTVLMLAAAVIVLVPLLNLLALSLSDPKRVAEVRGLDVIPRGFSLIVYRVLAANRNFLSSILNSLYITGMGTAINLVVTAMAAYALTRKSLPGRRLFMVLVIVIMVFEAGIVPEYLVVKRVGLMNTRWAVILYKAVNVYYLVILMRFFDEVPVSLLEAARVDGAGHGTVLRMVMLPLSTSAIATLGLFYGVMHWNEYFRAGLYLNSPAKYPLQLILRQFVILNDTTTLIGSGSMFTYDVAARLSYPALRAGTVVVAIIPVLVLYPLILRYYTRGVMEGSLKE
jgi:putative aldouronate transport system permease protein